MAFDSSYWDGPIERLNNIVKAPYDSIFPMVH